MPRIAQTFSYQRPVHKGTIRGASRKVTAVIIANPDLAGTDSALSLSIRSCTAALVICHKGQRRGIVLIGYDSLPPIQRQPAFTPSTTPRISRGRSDGRRRPTGARKTTNHFHYRRIAAAAARAFQRRLRRNRFPHPVWRDPRYGRNAEPDAQVSKRVSSAFPLHRSGRR